MLSALEDFYVEEKTKRSHLFHSSFMYEDYFSKRFCYFMQRRGGKWNQENIDIAKICKLSTVTNRTYLNYETFILHLNCWDITMYSL